MPQNRRAERPDEFAKQRRPQENSEQLRADIDAGRTGDKVDHPDPATAPLGTDAEAGGAGPAQADRRPREREAPARKRRWYGATSPEAAKPGLIALVVAIVVIAGLLWYFAAL